MEKVEEREPFLYTYFIKDHKLPKWRAGRYYINIGQYRKGRRRSLHFEWTSGLHSWLGLRLQWGGMEQDFQVMLGLGLATLWITPEDWTTWEHHLPHYNSHATGIMYYSGAITVDIWAPENDFSGTGRKRNYYIRPLDRLKDKILGKRKYSTEVISEYKETLSFLEGENIVEYPVVISMEIATWKRPRWWPMKLYRPEIKMQIPVPGKGENSWDIDEDCIYDSTLAGRKTPYTIEEVLKQETEYIMKERLRHGGLNWKPESQ